MHVFLVYLQLLRRNSLLKCVSQPEIAKKFTKTPYVIDVELLIFLKKVRSLVPIMTSSINLSTYAYQPFTRANTDKL